jgi:hypothetical protein
VAWQLQLSASMMRFTIPLLSIGLIACTVGSGEPLRSDEPSLALQGMALRAELQNSPVHTGRTAFSRIGMMIDADSIGAVQLATSQDGISWSDWKTARVRHVEANKQSAFNSELTLDSPARFFKLRGDSDATSFLRLDIMSDTQGADWENNGSATPKSGGNALFSQVASFGKGYTFRSRADWGATPVDCGGALDPVKMTIHHTDTPSNNPAARVRQIQDFHRNQNHWCDIGYHFLVDEQGVVYEGRKISIIGAHAGGANTGNVGIALIGSYESADPSAAQLSSTAKLVAEIASKYNIPLSRNTVKGHREVGSTSTDCPGARVFAKLANIIDAANNGSDEGADPNDNKIVDVEGYVYEDMDPNARVIGATVAIGNKTGVTGNDGGFIIAGVESKVQTVLVTKSGYTTAEVSRNIAASNWVSLSISQQSGGQQGNASLQGVIYRYGDSNDRIANATVTLSNGLSTIADENGFYILNDMAPGSVTITASAPGYSDASVYRDLVNGTTEWGSVPLQ